MKTITLIIAIVPVFAWCTFALTVACANPPGPAAVSRAVVLVEDVACFVIAVEEGGDVCVTRNDAKAMRAARSRAPAPSASVSAP